MQHDAKACKPDKSPKINSPMKITNRIFAAAAIAIFVVACVPAKKYQEAEQQASKYRLEKEECDVEVDLLKKKVAQLESDIEKLKAEKNALEQDTTLYGMKNRTLLNQLAILENDLRMLAAKMGDSPEYKALMKHLLQMQDELADSEGRRLDTELAIERQKKILADTEAALAESEEQLAASNQQIADKDLVIAGKDQEIAGKNQELAGKDEELADARRSIEEQAAKLREMEALLHAKDSAMAELRNTIASALVDFSGDDLTVYQKDGKVYVSLEEKLLFASGRYDVNAKGKEALRKISGVLATRTDLDIVVEGHTDNVPLRGQTIVDNWDLSVKRATSVVRILLENSSIQPSHIQAVGRADTQPIDPANTDDARRKNRRTEIILTPTIDKIMQILEQ